MLLEAFAWNAAEETQALPPLKIIPKSEERLNALFPWPCIYHISSECDGSLAGKAGSGNFAVSTKYNIQDAPRKAYRTFQISNFPC